MNKIEYSGKVCEQDLWKLFSDHAEKPSDTVILFSQLKPLLKGTSIFDLFRNDEASASACSVYWNGLAARFLCQA